MGHVTIAHKIAQWTYNLHPIKYAHGLVAIDIAFLSSYIWIIYSYLLGCSIRTRTIIPYLPA